MMKLMQTLAIIAAIVATALPGATSEQIYADEIRSEISTSVRAFLRTWMRPTTATAASRVAKDKALADTVARVRDAYALATVHGIELDFPLDAALAKGFGDLDLLLRKHAATDGTPTLSVRVMANILARGLLEGAAAAFAGVPPPRVTDPMDPVTAPNVD